MALGAALSNSLAKAPLPSGAEALSAAFLSRRHWDGAPFSGTLLPHTAPSPVVDDFVYTVSVPEPPAAGGVTVSVHELGGEDPVFSGSTAKFRAFVDAGFGQC